MEKTKNDYSVKSPVENTNEESKKFELKNKILLNFPDRKNLEDLPILYPVAKFSDNYFLSNSEKRRYEKTLQSFLNLRYLVENDTKNEEKHIIKVKTFIMQFLITNGILIKEQVESHKIINFIRFLKNVEIIIDKSKSLKETCENALNNDNYESDLYLNIAHKEANQLKDSINFSKMIKERKPRKKSKEMLILY